MNNSVNNTEHENKKLNSEWKSESIGQLADALSQAQGEFGVIAKGRTATIRSRKGDASSYSYKYADLSDVLEAIKKPLAKYGLALIQRIETTPKVDFLITILSHKSGEWVSSSSSIPQWSEIQALGSSLTYLRRYQLTALVGVIAEEDDDGNRGDGKNAVTKEREPNQGGPKHKPADKESNKSRLELRPATEEELKSLTNAMSHVDSAKFWAWLQKEFKITALEELSQAQFDKAMFEISGAIRRREAQAKENK